MSKRLEEEYRQMVSDQVPDLWDRIEAGLREKNSPPVGQSVQQPFQQSMQQPVGQNKPKKPVIFKILPWVGGVAAAAVIFILVVPTVLSLTRKNSASTKNAVFETADIYVEPGAGAAQRDVVAEAEGAVMENAYEDAVDAAELNGREELKYKDGGIRPGEEQLNVQNLQGQTSLKPDSKTETAGQNVEEETMYARVISVYTDSNTGSSRFTLIIGTDLEDVLKESDTDKQVADVLHVLSSNSPLKPVEGKTYRIEFDEYGILLMEEAK